LADEAITGGIHDSFDVSSHPVTDPSLATLQSMGLASDDTTAWARVLRGNGNAFGELFDRHQARVIRVALRMGFAIHDSEDLAAIAFAELWHKRRTVELVDGSVYPWLASVVVNLARNLGRSRARHRRLLRRLPLAPTHDAEDAAMASLEARERRESVRDALATLSESDREIIRQVVLDEADLASVGASLGISHGAAKVRLHRARRRLAEAMEAVGR
jgi:RNA polymerase sigma-70 factor (ECF subfamily)